MSSVPRNELGQRTKVIQEDGSRDYAGTKVPAKSGMSGVKELRVGSFKGQFQAVYSDPEGLIFNGPYRLTREEAAMDLIAVKSRMYL